MAKVTISGRTYDVEVRGDTVVVDGRDYPITVREEPNFTAVTAGGVPYRVQLPAAGERVNGMSVQVDYRPLVVEFDQRPGGSAAPRPVRAAAPGAAAAQPAAAVKGGVRAQIAGRVLSIKVKPGDAVSRGDVLLLLEAMKMENEIKAPADGVVKEILVAEGARVAEGEALLVLD
jgi:biotin carboxyl carrier protein